MQCCEHRKTTDEVKIGAYCKSILIGMAGVNFKAFSTSRLLARNLFTAALANHIYPHDGYYWWTRCFVCLFDV